jgi:protein O-GlcNAc transferase
MRTLPIDQMLLIARQHAQAARYGEAEGICHTILKSSPNHAPALRVLGNCAAGRGQHDAAIALLKRAAEALPGDPTAWLDVGNAATAGARWPDAVDAFARADVNLELAPASLRAYALAHIALKQPSRAIPLWERIIAVDESSASAHADLAAAHAAAADPAGAIVSYERAIALGDVRAATWVGLALALIAEGWTEAAIHRLDGAIQLAPEDAPARFHRGRLHAAAHEIDAAIAQLRKCVELNPRHTEAYGFLGTCLLDALKIDEALGCYAIASALETGAESPAGDLISELMELDTRIEQMREQLIATPDDTKLLYELASALRVKRLPDESAETYRRLLRVDPTHLLALNNLGMIYKDQGDIAAAIAHFENACAVIPEEEVLHGNLAYTMLFSQEHSSKQIGDCARAWARRFAAPLHRMLDFSTVDRTPTRRLRIGYVSPDFRLHPVGRLCIPWFEWHDHQQFEIFCYYNSPTNDGINQRFRAVADHWRDVSLMTDAQLANRIEEDRIDILIDLTMHMAGNRLRTFARKPAPLQVTYLAYAGTTGLRAIDYRLSDAVLDPPDRDESVYAEKTFRLPTCYWCYEPSSAAIEINPLPAERRGFVTFGSFNNFCKVSPKTLTLWRDILQRVPRSRLLLHTCAGDHRQRILDYFAEAGIDAGRVSFFDRIRLAFFYQLHHTVDIALDPFPYAGGTTTLDSLWMGIPTITLVGETAVARGGLTILKQLGLDEWASETPEGYIEAAVKLATDWKTLAHHRRTLRERLRESPLMDPQRFATEIQGAYRSMWERFCTAHASHQPIPPHA